MARTAPESRECPGPPARMGLVFGATADSDIFSKGQAHYKSAEHAEQIEGMPGGPYIAPRILSCKSLPPYRIKSDVVYGAHPLSLALDAGGYRWEARVRLPTFECEMTNLPFFRMILMNPTPANLNDSQSLPISAYIPDPEFKTGPTRAKLYRPSRRDVPAKVCAVHHVRVTFQLGKRVLGANQGEGGGAKVSIMMPKEKTKPTLETKKKETQVLDVIPDTGNRTQASPSSIFEPRANVKGACTVHHVRVSELVGKWEKWAISESCGGAMGLDELILSDY
ncbi:hypothetical protein B0H19DRAFT_1055570 [Mycena capillaripes]|nr:hypothetical protein B0H19DRAFT_1055570 [Mycena capillaripes]